MEAALKLYLIHVQYIYQLPIGARNAQCYKMKGQKKEKARPSPFKNE